MSHAEARGVPVSQSGRGTGGAPDGPSVRASSLGLQSPKEFHDFLQLLQSKSTHLPPIENSRLPDSLQNLMPAPIVEGMHCFCLLSLCLRRDRLLHALAGSLYYVSSRASGTPHVNDRVMYWPIEANLYYASFCLDFGPYNMAQLARFCNSVELLRTLVRTRLLFQVIAD